MTTKVAEPGDRSEESRRLAVPIPLSALDEEPLVSVLLSNYNYAHFLPESISSVLAQTYHRWELIVCDDGSTDNSVNVLTEFSGHDTRIHVYTKENGGQASCWNRAFREARGEIICLLDADDTFHPAKFERVIAAFRRNPRAGLAYHQYELTADDGSSLNLTPRPANLPEGWLFERARQQCGYVFLSRTSDLSFRRAVASDMFPIPEELHGFGDHFIGITTPFITEIAAIAEPLSTYRSHGFNYSGKGHDGQLTRSSVERLVYSTNLTAPYQQSFLRSRFGDELPDSMTLDDSPHYWQYLRALYILSGKPEEGAGGRTRAEIIASCSAATQRFSWTLLFRMPAPVGARLLKLWWGQSAWKRYVRPVASFLRINDRLT